MSKSNIPVLWWGWLLTMCAITGLFSLSFILLPDTMMAWASETYLHSPDATQLFGEDGVAYLRFILGTSGAISVAWMVALATVVLGPFRQRERWAWSVITVSVIIWFVLDCTNSVAASFPENVLYNIMFLIGFGIPLGATYHLFVTPASQ